MASLPAPPTPSLRLAHNLGFYVLIPAALGLIFGLQRTGVGMFLDVPTSVMFWTLTCFSAWITNDIGTRAAAAVLRPAGAPLWAVLLVGVLAGHLLNLPTWQWRVDHFVADPELKRVALPPPGFGPDYLLMVTRSLLIGSGLWLSANYAALLAFGLPRYGYGEAPDVEPAAAASDPPTDATAAGLSISHPDDVIAVQAQQHYIIVHRTGGQQMLHMRFGDAERILGPERGWRVHRSFWVAKHAIESIDRSGSSPRLRLRNGLSVPVGRTYLLNLRECERAVS